MDNRKKRANDGENMKWKWKDGGRRKKETITVYVGGRDEASAFGTFGGDDDSDIPIGA